jgi:hypothetical protein
MPRWVVGRQAARGQVFIHLLGRVGPQLLAVSVDENLHYYFPPEL